MTVVVGRDDELSTIRRIVAEAREGYAALTLEGGAGIGKTTLWLAGIDAAREGGANVLSSRATEAESNLSMTVVSDLLAPVSDDVFAALPSPQRLALEVALLRSEPGPRPPEARAVAAGLLAILRALAADAPVLIAIDDTQWLDRASADALTFAARRLEQEPVGFLLTARTGSGNPVTPIVEAHRAERLDVGAISYGAVRRLLLDRLALGPPRRILRQIHETTGGNPLFALELGRALAQRGYPAIGEELPHVGNVEELLGVRVAGLSKPVRKVLLAVALNGELRTSQLDALTDRAAADEALDAGLVLIDGDRVRASHPLVSAAAREGSGVGERRALHLALAAAAEDGTLRARHLALAAERPDASLAASVAAAAARALGRGAITDAVELAEHALRLTPAEAPGRPDRLVALAEYLEIAGEYPRMTELLTRHAEAVPHGAARARSHLLLAKVSWDLAAHEENLERAWEESEDDRPLRAIVLATKAGTFAGSQVERIRESEAWALEARRLAGPDVDPYIPFALGWCRILRGRPVDGAAADGAPATTYFESLDRVAGVRLAFRGQVEAARAGFARLLPLADERGEALSYAVLHLHLCELELRAGEATVAARLLDGWPEQSGFWLLPRSRCAALLAATRGLADEAARLASTTIAAAEAEEEPWDLLEATRARGIAALQTGNPVAAAESLRMVWEHAGREGVDDPGAFPVAPDLVEALAGLGELEQARAVTARLRELAEEQEHPWGLASATRCEGLTRLAADGYEESPAELMVAAACCYAELGLRFDQGRTLLALGRVQRRHRKWAAARASLEQAAAVFGDSGCTGWADEARSELARVGGRRPQGSGELTPSEQQVAELAAAGLANKEIAGTLSITVHTVERHLSRAYAKLGIRSRSQLARRLGAPLPRG